MSWVSVKSPGSDNMTSVLDPQVTFEKGEKVSSSFLESNDNEKNSGYLGGLLGMKYYPVMWGLFHKPWNKDLY